MRFGCFSASKKCLVDHPTAAALAPFPRTFFRLSYYVSFYLTQPFLARHWNRRGSNSTEVAFALRSQQPRVQDSSFLNFRCGWDSLLREWPQHKSLIVYRTNLVLVKWQASTSKKLADYFYLLSKQRKVYEAKNFWNVSIIFLTGRGNELISQFVNHASLH